MKKLALGAVAALLMAACTSNVEQLQSRAC